MSVMKSSIGLPLHDDTCLFVDVLPITNRRRRLLVSFAHDSGANKGPSAVTAHRLLQRKSTRESRTVCAAKKKKQQFGPGAGVATPGMLDEEVEAAYKQFGRALGETPRETSKVVRAKYNIPAAPPQQAARRPVTSGGPSERRFTEESYAQFEAMLNSAMKGSGDSQPRALVKGKNTVAIQAGERERRKVMMELMESTLSPEAAPFSLDLGLDRIRPAAQRPEEEVPQLILPRGKMAAPAKRPAATKAEGMPPTKAGPLPVPTLQMPRGKLPKRERPVAAAAAPAAPPRPLPTPAVAPKPSLGPPKVDWKITEIDEDYLDSTQDVVSRRPAPPVPEKQPPPKFEEPLPAIVRPPKPRTEPETVPESRAPTPATSAEQPATAKATAVGEPAKAPKSKLAERTQEGAAGREQATKPEVKAKRAVDESTLASTAASPGAPPRQSRAEEAAAEKPAAPVRPPAPPVPTLQRPPIAPASAEPPRAAAAADAQTSAPGADAAAVESSAASAAGNAAELRVTPDAAEAVSGGAGADVAARSAGDEEDVGSSAAAAGAAAHQDEMPPQAAAAQLPDSRAIKASRASAGAVSAAVPVAPLQQPVPPASKPVRPQPVSAAVGREDVHDAYDAAMAAFMAQQPLPGVVTQVLGTSGVIVRVQGKFRGFLPWSKLLARRQAGLLERERAAWAAMDVLEDKSEEQAARAQLRRSIMGAIVEQRVMVYVHQVEAPPEGSNKVAKVLLSERGPVYKPDMGIPPYASEVLEQKLGERVECTVAKLTRYGVFLNFAVDVAHDCTCEIYGLMHHSKMGGLAGEPLQEGQDVTAYIADVDVVNGRVQLWAEPPKSGLPLNQTLEDLLRRSTSEGPQSDEGEEAMPEAMEVCRELLLAGAITEAQPGRRLQGRAFSPEVQVFMAKGDEQLDNTSAQGEVKRYTLLARARNEVQEIDVESALDREEMKAAMAQALSSVLEVQ